MCSRALGLQLRIQGLQALLTCCQLGEQGLQCGRVVGHPIGVDRPRKDALLVQLLHKGTDLLGRACGQHRRPVIQCAGPCCLHARPRGVGT